MLKLKLLVIFFGFCSSFILSAQDNQRGQYRVMFYNVENLFDTIDTPNKFDEEFLPDGTKKWGNYRYWTKINKIFQVIAATGEGEPPDIIGLCEVESFLPLYNLSYNTPLSKFPYTIIHHESPDARGIDVALLIRNGKVKLLNEEFLEVVFPGDSNFRTREILHATLQIQNDTLHVFVNHWPSRRGGQIKSEPKRNLASGILTEAINSIKIVEPNAKIIILGDFNDEPQNNSIKRLVSETELVNLSETLQENCKCGTYRYKSEWNMLDQVLISQSLLKQERLSTAAGRVKIYDSEFLLVDDSTYGGMKPYRTFLGPRYIGGYSDHLPVILDLEYNSEK